METEFAPAKVNLTLHVTGQRDDGYHLLDSLVVFPNIGDSITTSPADSLSLTIGGPQAAHLVVGRDNLVLRAARLMGATVALTLEKRLPVASGIGGGSADAAATLRLLSRVLQRPLPDAAAILGLGADVPACLAGRALRMSGVGEVIMDVPPLPVLNILLVNPGVSVATPRVFSALKGCYNPPMVADLPAWPDARAFCDWLKLQRNDLESPAISLAPEITQALTLMRQTDCLFAGMSGSGATCFGLFPPDGHSAEAARAHLFTERPDWWAAVGQIR